MKIINRILLIVVLSLSILIGMFPNIRSSTLYYIMYAITILLMFIYLCDKVIKKRLVVNVYSIIVFVCLIFRNVL